MKQIISSVIILFSTTCFTQVNLSFQSRDLNPFLVSDTLSDESNDTLQISTFKMYISNIELKNGNKLVYKEKNSFHLIDFSDPNSTFIQLTNKNLSFTSIRFQIGVDSSTTVSGVMGGDLDPTKGMYWTWQTGYIHFKLEGKYNNSTVNNFIYHIGGFQFPTNSLRVVEIQVKDKKNIAIDFQGVNFLEASKNLSIFNVMSPGKNALDLIDIAAKCFKLSE